MTNLSLLALDTATEGCSVALLHAGEITANNELAQRSHTKRILPMIDELLAQSGISLRQLDGLVFGRGPGSFTGVRVGAGIAQGLAFGADLPVIPVSNLTAMAQAAYEQYGSEQVMAAIDARMNEVYFSCLQAEKVRCDRSESLRWQHVMPEQVVSPENALAQCLTLPALKTNWTAVGTGWQAYLALQQVCDTPQILLPEARYMLPLALEKWRNQEWISAVQIEPVYLRNEVTWQKLPGRE